MKNTLLLLPLLFSSFVSANNFETQKAQCIDAANIVKNQDYEAFKQIAPLKVRAEEQAIKRLVDKQNDKYTKSRYAGIKNFLIKDFELVEEPQSHRVSVVRRSVEKWQASQVLKVNYAFDTTVVRTNKEQSVGGFCLFALIDDAWYMTNLLK
ncbi:hypothetical protein [Thalassotalea fusca]